MEKMKYPIGIQDFKSIREDGYVYVDKTALIYDMVSSGKIYFLSRPRRFGKSLLVSTLKYYYEGDKQLFSGLAIDALEHDWKHYPIFHLDFNGISFFEENALQRCLDAFVSSFEDIYGRSPYDVGIGGRFAYVLQAAHKKTGLRCVVLIDEYDKPLLDVIDTKYTTTVGDNTLTVETMNREILKGFYSVFKAADADLQFVLLTGVTKFSQVSVFSGFNQPNDISMVPRYDALCGITKEELHSVFAASIRQLAAALEYSEEEMYRKLRQQYDGYHFSSRMTDIYNPFSLLNAFNNLEIDDYWFKTGTPTYLIRLLNHCKENINEMVGKYYSAAQFIDYKADVERPLPMIYQSGYFTVKDYDRDLRAYKLDFPNDEVASGFLSLLSANYFECADDPQSWILMAVSALRGGDIDKYRDLLTSFLSSIPYSARRKENEREQERYFQYTIYLLMRMMSVYTMYHEKQTSQGRADCIIETPQYIYIFEYKLDEPATDAIAQIDAKGYAREYAHDSRKLYKIGCTFSSETGTVSDWQCAE